MAVWQELAGKLMTKAGSVLKLNQLRERGVEQRQEAIASDAAGRARRAEKAREGEARGEAAAARLNEEKRREQARAERFADMAKSERAPGPPDVPGEPKNPG